MRGYYLYGKTAGKLWKFSRKNVRRAHKCVVTEARIIIIIRCVTEVKATQTSLILTNACNDSNRDFRRHYRDRSGEKCRLRKKNKTHESYGRGTTDRRWRPTTGQCRYAVPFTTWQSRRRRRRSLNGACPRLGILSWQRTAARIIMSSLRFSAFRTDGWTRQHTNLSRFFQRNGTPQTKLRKRFRPSDGRYLLWARDLDETRCALSLHGKTTITASVITVADNPACLSLCSFEYFRYFSCGGSYFFRFWKACACIIELFYISL